MITKTHNNRSAECSDPSCPCHAWSARIPLESPALPERDAGFHVSEAKNVLSSDSEPNSPILTVEQTLAELREMFPKSRCQVTITDVQKGGFGVMDFDYEPHLYPHASKQEAEIWLMDVTPWNSERGLKMRAPTLTEAMDQVRKWHEEQQ